jgi:YHS domain-containing protein
MARSNCLVFLLIATVVSASWLGSAVAGSSPSPVAAVNTADGFALKGYDPVAYFTDEHPTKGEDQYSFQWKGVTYRFASAENLQRFQADPEKYLPQYMPKTFKMRESCQYCGAGGTVALSGPIRRASSSSARRLSASTRSVSLAASIRRHLPSVTFGNAAQFESADAILPLLFRDQRVWLKRLLFR